VDNECPIPIFDIPYYQIIGGKADWVICVSCQQPGAGSDWRGRSGLAPKVMARHIAYDVGAADDGTLWPKA